MHINLLLGFSSLFFLRGDLAASSGLRRMTLCERAYVAHGFPSGSRTTGAAPADLLLYSVAIFSNHRMLPVNAFYIGVSQDETWGGANLTQCQFKLNLTQNVRRRVMNLKITRDSRNVAWETPRRRRNAPYTALRGVARGPKAAVMTLSMFSNDSLRLDKHLALRKVDRCYVHT